MNTYLVETLVGLSAQVSVDRMPSEKDMSYELRELLLPINLKRAIRLFPNYLESIILQWEQLFPSEKHSRQLPIFPGVNILASSLQGQNI